MNLYIIIFRTFFYYILFLLLFRIMGKREIGELGINDLLVSVLFAQFATIGIENYNIPLFQTLIPTIIIVLLEVVVSFLSLKSVRFRTLVDFNPSVIIKDGNINFKEMEKQRYSIEDLLMQIRDKGIKSLDEIEYAILENNGKLSVFLFDNKKIYPMPLILDGKIQYDTLNSINKTKDWLIKVLKQEKTTIEDVFYAFYRNNKCFIIKREIK
ncbi:MAG: DUF421 domain-containing protein [Bacilli bacterium]|nr:DUF421 domain-containing protein [Bacilli bacterium]MBQ6282653.1 DUF421 domain-containing protein [Bacilli bacterium]